MAKTNKPSVRPAAHPIRDDVFARSIARINAMTPPQLAQSLRDAGIVTAKGNYTKPYRMLGSPAGR